DRMLNIVTSVLLIIALSWIIFWGFVEMTIALPILVLFLGWAVYRGALTAPRAFWLHQIDRVEVALYSDTRGDMQSSRDGIGGSFLMGVVFSAGWTPCIGPLLGAILTMAATTGEIGSS